MARISLREYTRQVERIIENGQGLDEAIAHCRHILKTFPKHLETYRLLGKAYLEAKRYSEAVDVFQRLLIAVPDDFVAHVGMSIIADDQGKLDDAIWHMERAFEVQPANAAIQAELQRLFGRRDGIEPPKIRLTRGALAHMYVQGELYPQAISEARAVLADDPQRADIQVLLAKAYFHNGQKSEASELCSQLLKRFPYCFEANRILVELLPAAKQRSDSIPIYRHRVTELDPYAAFAQGSVFNSDDVPDEAVTLERLEYVSQAADMGAAWGMPRGGLTGTTEAEAPQPDWLKSAAPEPRPTPAPTVEAEIPDFLRQAGWSEARGEATEEAHPFEEGEILPSAVEAELPEWIKSIAPSAEEAEEETAQPAPETLEWFKTLGVQEPPEPQTPAQPRRPDESQAIESPDWLKGMEQNLEARWPESRFSAPAPEEAPPAAPPVLPEEQPRPPLVSEAPSTISTLGTSAQEQDDALAWLESLAAKHGAKPEELITDPNARTETPPEWVHKAREIGEAALPEDQTGMWLKSLEAQEAKAPAPSQDRLSTAGETEPSPPMPAQEQESPSEEVPEWLHAPESPSVKESPPWIGAPESPPVPPSAEEKTPPWLSTPESPSVPPSEEEIPSWLGTLAPPSTAGEEGIPPWLDTPESPSISPLPEEEETPSWLRAETAGTTETPEAPAAAADLPEWLAGLEREAPAAPTPWPDAEAEPQTTERARPADWRPIEEPTAELPPTRPPAETKAPPPARARPSPPPTPDAGEASLEAAQAELGRGNIAAALQTYNRLIRKGKMLDEIIRELREALYRYPVDVSLWQALGDAYMRANRLQEALDAYTKAEELLR